MTGSQQRAALQNQIWKIANDVRGAVDGIITPAIKEDAIKTRDYFIYPGQLFSNIAKNASTNNSLNTDLATIFAEIEA